MARSLGVGRRPLGSSAASRRCLGSAPVCLSQWKTCVHSGWMEIIPPASKSAQRQRKKFEPYMKTIISLLTIVILAGLKIQADDASVPARNSVRPNFKGGDYDPPVYTSPTNGISAHLTNTITAPVITNRPATNLPATNHLPPMTNPPALQPPGR